ncbi:MAG: alpha/beta hydrolase [Segniliparus sp.]|uniref:alpha/beta hydrolase n=1 Tax=Segniliparus sp. TaxID=2804064 RepID=UPI003F39119F
MTIPLGDDPDGEGEIFATLVKHVPPDADGAPRGAVLHVHGYNDYFFQRGLAEHFAARGYRFYAVDLRKCGRSRRPWLTPHYSSDFAQYDVDIRAALETIQAELGPAFPGGAVSTLVHGHSTGGLIAPLAVARERRDPASAASRLVRGLVLNSPFVELPAPAPLRFVAKGLAETVGRLAPMLTLPQGGLGAYGESLHKDYRGEWDYSLERKPLLGPPLRLGWLRAVTRAQREWHHGVDVGVPALVLHSDRSYLSGSDPEKLDSSDAVLDVSHIKRWAGFLTPQTDVVQIPQARHDVFLSRAEARTRAYAALDQWLDERVDEAPPAEKLG